MKMNKLGISIAMTILCSILMAFPHTIAQAPVSATQSSMGFMYSGGAYIWSNNPLNAWTNPAKLGFQQGISNGYFFDDYDTFSKVKKDASMMAIGWNGIGILLPTVNTSGKFGHTIDYGEWSFNNYSDGTYLGTGNCYHTIQQYALGVNFMELMRDGDPWDKINRGMFDLSLGVAVTHYLTNATYNFDPEEEGYTSSTSNDVDEYFYNAGMIAKFSTFANSDLPYRLDFSLGTTWLNITEVDAFIWDYEYIDDDDKKMFSNGLLYSGSAYGAILPFNKPYSFFDHTINELLSVAYTYDYFDNEFGSHDNDVQSWGLEYGLLNTFYIRHGQYNFNPVKWGYTNDCFGLGLKLRYRDLIEYEWNYAETEYLTDMSRCWDMMLNVNLMKIIDVL